MNEGGGEDDDCPTLFFRMIFNDQERLGFLINMTLLRLEHPTTHSEVLDMFLKAFVINQTPDFRVVENNIFFFASNKKVYLTKKQLLPTELAALNRLIPSYFATNTACEHSRFTHNHALQAAINYQTAIKMCVIAIISVSSTNIDTGDNSPSARKCAVERLLSVISKYISGGSSVADQLLPIYQWLEVEFMKKINTVQPT
jgi:hypothetical protein